MQKFAFQAAEIAAELPALLQFLKICSVILPQKQSLASSMGNNYFKISSGSLVSASNFTLAGDYEKDLKVFEKRVLKLSYSRMIL